MPIITNNPTRVPAEESKVYDIYWIRSIQIMSRDPAGKIKARIVAHKARTLEDRSIELSPTDRDEIFNITDIAARAANRPSLAAAMDAVIAEAGALISESEA